MQKSWREHLTSQTVSCLRIRNPHREPGDLVLGQASLPAAEKSWTSHTVSESLMLLPPRTLGDTTGSCMATDRTSRPWKRPDQSGKGEARALGALCSTVTRVSLKAPVSMQTPWLVCSGLSAWRASLPSHSQSRLPGSRSVACRRPRLPPGSQQADGLHACLCFPPLAGLTWLETSGWRASTGTHDGGRPLASPLGLCHTRSPTLSSRGAERRSSLLAMGSLSSRGSGLPHSPSCPH